MAGAVRIGIAGWVFEPWRGHFYPEGLVQKKELAYAAERLGMIEINATFRANQKPASFQRWASETPEDFVLAVKGPQIVTHIRRLKDVAEPLANFFASGVFALGARLGPFVWQLPPNLKFEAERLSAFLELLPKSVEAARTLAERADGARLAPFLDTAGISEIRHAIDARHDSFFTAEAEALLAAHGVALVISDTPERPQRTVTAPFVYARLQGPARAGASGYEPDDLDALAGEITAWRDEGRDVFALFVHEDKVNAPLNAIALMARLGLNHTP
jgi:uncharacterized protein YecE (DUF72 family)